jgi:hypothetical protein
MISDDQLDDLLAEVEDDLTDGERSAITALIASVKVLDKDDELQVRRHSKSIRDGVRRLLVRAKYQLETSPSSEHHDVLVWSMVMRTEANERVPLTEHQSK